MLRTIEMYTNEYKDTTQKEIRKKKGQFFTPAEVSMRMAAVESEYPKNQWIRVLDRSRSRKRHFIFCCD